MSDGSWGREMLICLACVLTGLIVPLDVLSFPKQPLVPEAHTLWRCPNCFIQGEYA